MCDWQLCVYLECSTPKFCESNWFSRHTPLVLASRRNGLAATSGSDTTNAAEAAAMWHYTNLKPMWGSENIRKSNKYDPKAKAEYMRAWSELAWG